MANPRRGGVYVRSSCRAPTRATERAATVASVVSGGRDTPPSNPGHGTARPGRSGTESPGGTANPMPRIRLANVAAAGWSPNGATIIQGDLTTADSNVFGKLVFGL